MKKTLIIILAIFLIFLAVAGYYVYNVRRLASLAENHNKTYEDYYQEEILGTTLISIINKAIDSNEKNAIEKLDNSIYYEDNEKNSIKITVQFLEADDIIFMEDIAQNKIENFVKYFATATFKCTKIEYHTKTNYIKSLQFEQTQL